MIFALHAYTRMRTYTNTHTRTHARTHAQEHTRTRTPINGNTDIFAAQVGIAEVAAEMLLVPGPVLSMREELVKDELRGQVTWHGVQRRASKMNQRVAAEMPGEKTHQKTSVEGRMRHGKGHLPPPPNQNNVQNKTHKKKHHTHTHTRTHTHVHAHTHTRTHNTHTQHAHTTRTHTHERTHTHTHTLPRRSLHSEAGTFRHGSDRTAAGALGSFPPS